MNNCLISIDFILNQMCKYCFKMKQTFFLEKEKFDDSLEFNVKKKKFLIKIFKKREKI